MDPQGSLQAVNTKVTRTDQDTLGQNFAAPLASAPIAIEAKALSKSFRIPTHRVDTLKERFTKPFAAREYRQLHALDEVSFEIRQGEFFGIVGRNGSGKSTLLKLLASIYRPDAGSIRMAGRLAPFIELGVGFNAELTARENVVLNGVMMGLTPQEARSRLGAVLEFAELEDFVDLKLKNYSSGMLVRLAFSVMMQADADIMLIDEVLAVGDAAFQQKCADAFHEMKAQGKTIVLVTHEMSTVETYCHRAMLISDGHIQYVGDPAEVGRRYLRLNFDKGSDGGLAPETEANADVALIDARVEDDSGNQRSSVEQGRPIRLRVDLRAKRYIEELDVGFVIVNADGVGVTQFGGPIRGNGSKRSLDSGDTATIRVEIANPLTAGRYFIHLGVNVAGTAKILLYVHNCMDLVIYGGATHGIVSLDHEISAEIHESRSV